MFNEKKDNFDKIKYYIKKNFWFFNLRLLKVFEYYMFFYFFIYYLFLLVFYFMLFVLLINGKLNDLYCLESI